jgi:hypothetical protein
VQIEPTSELLWQLEVLGQQAQLREVRLRAADEGGEQRLAPDAADAKGVECLDGLAVQALQYSKQVNAALKWQFWCKWRERNYPACCWVVFECCSNDRRMSCDEGLNGWPPHRRLRPEFTSMRRAWRGIAGGSKWSGRTAGSVVTESCACHLGAVVAAALPATERGQNRQRHWQTAQGTARNTEQTV